MSDKLDSDIKKATRAFEISTHTFIGRIVEGISKKIPSISEDLKVVPVNKRESSGVIKLELAGQVVVSDVEQAEIKQKMDAYILSLKNPANLLSLLR